MKLTIDPGVPRATTKGRPVLRLVGAVLGTLAGGVRRITVRVPPPTTTDARPTLVLERRTGVTVYQLDGALRRWATLAAARLRAHLVTPSPAVTTGRAR